MLLSLFKVNSNDNQYLSLHWTFIRKLRPTMHAIIRSTNRHRNVLARATNAVDAFIQPQQQLPKHTVIPSRNKYYNNRHRDPKYRLERTRKVWKVEIPDFDDMRKQRDEDMDPDQIRSKMKEKGIAPPNKWEEREMYAPATLTIMEQYKPQPGDGKFSVLSKFRHPLTTGKEFVKTKRAVNAIRDFEGDEFNLDTFAEQVTHIYIKAHEALASKDNVKIFDYVTEHCVPMMTAGLVRQTIMWKYMGDVQPPQVVQVRVGELLDKTNKYAQITVRMFTKQLMAIYDRHGRLVYGGPNDVREVLEYVVFEKYLANEYGQWRIHGRIRPIESVQKISDVAPKTYVVKESSKQKVA